MKYLIGNWKANKNQLEVEEWFKTFASLFNKEKLNWLNNLQVVICPPFVYLPKTERLIKDYNLPIKTGAQDVSPFGGGAWTGEVSGSQIKEFADFVIIGHSERRKNFSEDDQMLKQKVKQANEAELQIVFCVPDEKTFIPDSVSIVAYEPVWAIGSGMPDTPENASRVASVVKDKSDVEVFIYGGSVKPDNIKNFLAADGIDGVLPGGSSLSPLSFWEMIVNAASI